MTLTDGNALAELLALTARLWEVDTRGESGQRPGKIRSQMIQNPNTMRGEEIGNLNESKSKSQYLLAGGKVLARVNMGTIRKSIFRLTALKKENPEKEPRGA